MEGSSTTDLLSPNSVSYRMIIWRFCIFYSLQPCLCQTKVNCHSQNIRMEDVFHGVGSTFAGFSTFLYLLSGVEVLLPCSQPTDSCNAHSYGCNYSTSAFRCLLCQENPNFFIIHQMGSQDPDVGSFHFLGYHYFSVTCGTCP